MKLTGCSSNGGKREVCHYYTTTKTMTTSITTITANIKIIAIEATAVQYQWDTKIANSKIQDSAEITQVRKD